MIYLRFNLNMDGQSRYNSPIFRGNDKKNSKQTII